MERSRYAESRTLAMPNRGAAFLYLIEGAYCRRRGGLAACGGWSILHPPIFCATENAPVRRWKRAPGGLAPWPPCVPLDETTSPGGNQESPPFLLSLPLPWWKCRRFSFYRFLSVDAMERRPCVRGAAPVRTLGLRGCNRFSESDETAGEGCRKLGSPSSTSPTKLEDTGYNPSGTSLRTGTTSPHPQGVCDIPKRQSR